MITKAHCMLKFICVKHDGKTKVYSERLKYYIIETDVDVSIYKNKGDDECLAKYEYENEKETLNLISCLDSFEYKEYKEMKIEMLMLDDVV